MNPLDLPALRKIAEAADRGEWLLSGHTKGYQGVESSNDPHGWIVCPDAEYKTVTDVNATHIAAFNPSTVLDLLSDLEKMREALVGVCLTYGHAGESIEDDYAHVYRMARECLSQLKFEKETK